MQQASHQADSSVALYYFNASLYLLRVLKGNTTKKGIRKSQKQQRVSANTGSRPQDPQVSQAWPERTGRSPELCTGASTGGWVPPPAFHSWGFEDKTSPGPNPWPFEGNLGSALIFTIPLSHLAQAASCLDLNFVTSVYSAALSSFLTKRNSPLTVSMFLSLFSRLPVSVRPAMPPEGSCLAQ